MRRRGWPETGGEARVGLHNGGLGWGPGFDALLVVIEQRGVERMARRFVKFPGRVSPADADP